MSPNRFVRLFALLAVLVLAPTPVAAAASPQNTPAGFEIRYNAGDEDPGHGPNSFVITVGDCPPSWFVQYRWGAHQGQIAAPCGRTTVVSLAPLGANEYPLEWRSCSVTWWRYPPRPHTVCGEYHQDVVRTD